MAIAINGTTGISGVDGSASAPALQGSDSNTGVSFGTDIVNINTGGTTRATVDSSGALDVPSNFPIKVNGSEKLRIDSSGNLGIGNTSPQGQLHIGASTGTSDREAIIILNNGGGSGQEAGIEWRYENVTTPRAKIHLDSSSQDLRFATANSERMRIDSSGRLLISTTSTSAVTGGSTNAKFFDAADGCRLMSSRSSTAAREHAVFHNPNGDVGDITTSGSSTSFNTSSDYRLKENVTAISDGITRLKTLKPSRFNFKVDKDTTVDGFIAHEVTAVPEAITGTKDEVDSDKNPVYQGIDQSKLVPLLTAALQEAVAKIEVLETKVAALEAG